MKVQVIENEDHFMSEDFKRWIRLHKEDVFKVKEECIGYNGSPAYILYKVPFRISKYFIKELI